MRAEKKYTGIGGQIIPEGRGREGQNGLPDLSGAKPNDLKLPLYVWEREIKVGVGGPYVEKKEKRAEEQGDFDDDGVFERRPLGKEPGPPYLKKGTGRGGGNMTGAVTLDLWKGKGQSMLDLQKVPRDWPSIELLLFGGKKDSPSSAVFRAWRGNSRSVKELEVTKNNCWWDRKKRGGQNQAAGRMIRFASEGSQEKPSDLLRTGVGWDNVREGYRAGEIVLPGLENLIRFYRS